MDVNYEYHMAYNVEDMMMLNMMKMVMRMVGDSYMVKKGFLPQISITKKQSEQPGICIGGGGGDDDDAEDVDDDNHDIDDQDHDLNDQEEEEQPSICIDYDYNLWID